MQEVRQLPELSTRFGHLRPIESEFRAPVEIFSAKN
jgi:hypothetical protein